MVAAVCLDVRRMPRPARLALADLDDSKRLSPASRDILAAVIVREARRVVVRSASAAVIDRDGLHRTNVRLLREAVAALGGLAEIAVVDGRPLGEGAPPHRPVVGGDRRSASVAAASVIAKTVRDRLMRGPAAAAFPEYGFAKHVGYATAEHRVLLARHGPCPLHRRSFIWTTPATAEARPDRLR